MFGDLLELTTALIHPDHTPDISPHIATSSSSNAKMPPKSRHSKSRSVSTVADANEMPPPATPASKNSTPLRKSRLQSSISPPASPVVVATPRPERKSQIPKFLQFIMVVILSGALEVLLQSIASTFTTGDLAAVSKHSESWSEVAGLLAWKVLQLGLYWFSNFDAYDVASLTLLLSTPSTLLLGLFYQIHPFTLTATTLASILANSIPWLLLRPLAPSHSPTTAPKTSLKNRPILVDPYTTISTSLLATAIFAVLLQVAFATFLPTWLVINFTGLRSLEAAYLGSQGLPVLLLALVPAGVACMEFLFAPSTAAAGGNTSISFNPATSGFRQHVYHNAWGWYSSRQKELIGRTALLATLMMAETVVQVWGTIAGAEFVGAVGYAAVWAVGVGVLGTVLDWVGGPSD